MRRHLLYCTITCAVCVLVFPLTAFAQSDSTSVRYLLARADSLMGLEEYEAAGEIYKKILELDEEVLAAYAGLGKIACEAEKWGDGEDQFNRILKRDPDNLEAHYYRGICLRETGKYKALLLRKLDWDRSRRHFSTVIARDSTFRDVLYQYALLHRYREDYADAIQAGEAQVRLRPELTEPQVKLFRLYRYFISYKNTDEAVAWLEQQPWERARYYIGEKYRREGMLEKADSLYNDLLHQPLVMSLQPIYLSLARVYYAQGFPELGQRYIDRAIREIRSDADADLVFEDVKYIITDQELEAYRSLNPSQSKIQFFITLWILRDPTPAARTNVRLAEHYRRLLFAERYYEYDGFRGWFANPDSLGYLEFPKTNSLNGEFNDKGLIYIRHGEPNDKILTGGEEVPFNESWLYYGTQDIPRMTFHFMLAKSGNDWRFAPVITNAALLDDRLTWGSIYYRLLRAEPIEQYSIQQEMADMSKESVKAGLSSDRHTWAEEAKPLQVPVTVETFRGDNGKTIVEFSHDIHVDDLYNEKKYRDTTVDIEKGFIVYDSQWEIVVKKEEDVGVSVEKDRRYIDLYRFEVEPNSYNIAFHAKAIGTEYLGGWKFTLKVDDYTPPALAVSDIQLATRIEPAQTPSQFVKNNLSVIPNPSHSYARSAPACIYFEIYNLSEGEDGTTHYTIEYLLENIKGDKGGVKNLFGLFGGKAKGSLSIRTVREGKGEFSVEYSTIDISNIEAGDYDLTVIVTDDHRGTSSRRNVKMTVM